jgi:hypothetical protein
VVEETVQELDQEQLEMLTLAVVEAVLISVVEAQLEAQAS